MKSDSVFDRVSSAATRAIYATHGTAVMYTKPGQAERSVKICIEESNALNVTDAETFDAPEIADNASQFDRIVATVLMSEVRSLQDGDTFHINPATIWKVLASTITNDGIEWSFEAVHRRPETNLFDLDGQRAVWGDEDDE